MKHSPRWPRRWLQIRLRTVFLLATAICVYFAWPHLARQYALWRLYYIGDRDVGDLWGSVENVYDLKPRSSETARVEKLVRRLVPAQSRFESFFGGKPWLIRRLNAKRARLMIVNVRPPFSIPGSGDVRVILLDGIGRIIADKTISTGNRFFPRRIKYEPIEHEFPYLAVECDYFWRGWEQCQYIAVHDERIAEVRVVHKTESEEKHGYWSKDVHELGSEYDFANISEWSKALSSDDSVDVLEALLHLPPREAIVARKRSDIERLRLLSRSSDSWIRDGAAKALREFDLPNEK